MKKARFAAILAACAIAMSGCSAGSGTTVVTVGDTKVSGKALDFYITELMGAGSSFDDAKQQAAESIEEMLKLTAVGEAWGLELSDEENDNIKDSLIRIRQQMGGKKAFDKTLKKYGVTEDFVKDLIAASVYSEKIEEELDVEEPTDDELKQYFTEHYLRAKHVLVATQDTSTGEEKDAETAKATADEVLSKAQAGEDFDSLISQYNEDPGMESNPDGYIFTDNEMVSEFEDKTKELQPGEVGMCETSYGYHIIKRLALDETPELFEQFFEDNKSSITDAAEQAKIDEAIDAKAQEYNITCEINTDAVESLESMSTPEPEETTSSEG